MPLLLWPFPSGVAPPVIARSPDGKVFIIDSTTKSFYGPAPTLRESCTLVFRPLISGVPKSGQAVHFTFTDPNGQVLLGDPNFAFVSQVTISEIFPIANIPPVQLVYVFGVGELDVAGRWSVMATVGALETDTATFVVSVTSDVI